MLFALWCVGILASQDPAPAAPPGERGFVLHQRGREVGDESFTLTRSGGQVDVRCRRRLRHESWEADRWERHVADSSLDVTLSLAGGRPVRYAHTETVGTRSGRVEATFEGGAGRLRSDGRDRQIAVRTDAALAIDGAAIHFALAAAQGPGPVQLLVPQVPRTIDGHIRSLGTALFRRGAAVLEARHLRIEFAAFWVDVWLAGGEAVRVRDSRADVTAIAASHAEWRLDEAPAGVTEEPVAVAGGGVRLAGTFARPSRPGRVPALLLLSGSGPDPRDARIAGHPFLDTIAWDLAQSGIGSLRLDDRGVGGSGGDFTRIRLRELVADAEAALGALRARADVGRVGLLGHSEGAMIACLVAAHGGLEQRPPVPVFLLGCPALPLDAVIEEQAVSLALLERVRVEDADALRERHERIRATTGDELELGGRRLRVGWLRDHFAHSPTDTVARIAGPIEVFHGLADANVLPAHADLLESVLAFVGHARARVHRLAGLDHAFMRFDAAVPPGSPGRGLDASFRALLVSRVLEHVR